MVALDAYPTRSVATSSSWSEVVRSCLPAWSSLPLSLNVNVVTQDATHRYRAIDTLTAMTGIFVICAFALMEAKTTALWASNGSWSQPSRSPYTYTGTSRPSVAAEALPGFAEGVIVAAVLYLTQMVGAALLVADQIAGLYVAAVAMVAAMTLMISGAWLYSSV